MKDPIVIQLEKEIAHLESQVAARREMIAARLALNGSAVVTADAPLAVKERERAPRHGLKEAMLAALIGSKGMTKMDIVKKLAANGYGFSVRPAHVARNLVMLKKAHKVTATKRGLANVYCLR